MSAQRNTRLLGTFARLNRRDGKPQYLRHQPRIWTYLTRSLAHPVLAGLREWYSANVPAPGPSSYRLLAAFALIWAGRPLPQARGRLHEGGARDGGRTAQGRACHIRARDRRAYDGHRRHLAARLHHGEIFRRPAPNSPSRAPSRGGISRNSSCCCRRPAWPTAAANCPGSMATRSWTAGVKRLKRRKRRHVAQLPTLEPGSGPPFYHRHVGRLRRSTNDAPAESSWYDLRLVLTTRAYLDRKASRRSCGIRWEQRFEKFLECPSPPPKPWSSPPVSACACAP